MKKIIVPVDFSEYSERALQTASYLAKFFDAEVLPVHMLELSNALISRSESAVNEQTVFYYKLAEKRFKEFLDKDFLKEVKVTPIIKHFKVFSELNALARDENADMIVMGSHGATGVKEFFVGSNTEKVVRNAEIPVLVIKNEAVTTSFKSAVFACDFSDEDIEPYQQAKALLAQFNCTVNLLHVNTPNSKFRSTKEMQEKVASFLQKAEGSIANLDKVHYVADYTIEDGILEFSNVHGKDVIIMATHGRKGLQHFIEGSISEDVANHATLPVLTFKI